MSKDGAERLNQIYVDEMQEMVAKEVEDAHRLVLENRADIAKKEAALANETDPSKLALREADLKKAKAWRLSKQLSPMMFWGPPGCAKTQGIEHAVREVVSEKGLRIGFITTFMSAYDPVAVRGMPTVDHMNKLTQWYPQESFPSEKNCGEYDVVVWMLDELPAAPRAVQPILYRLLQEGQVEGYVVPKNVFMIAAGNDKDDRAIAVDMSSAMANRMIHFDVRPTFEPWKQWAIPAGIHPMVIAFHNMTNGEHLHKMDTETLGMMKGFPTYRTWERVSQDLYKYEKSSEHMRGLRTAGHIGVDVGWEFNAFYRLFDELKDPEAILEGKEKSVPHQNDVIYATLSNLVSALLKKSSEERVNNFFAYIDICCKERKEMGYMAVNDLFRSKNREVIRFAMKTPGWANWADQITDLNKWQ